MRSLIRAVYRFRDATLVAEKKDDFGNALRNLYRELEMVRENTERRVEGWSDVQTQIKNQIIRSAGGQVSTDRARF